MTGDEAKRIAGRISVACRYEWSIEKRTEFAKAIAFSTIASVDFQVVDNTLTRLLGEVNPDTITVASLTEAVKTRPVLPKRRYLPPPEDGSGTAERPIYFPPDNGKEPFPVAHPDEAERERLRAQYARSELPAAVIRRRDLGITAKHIADADAWRRQQVTKIEGELAALKKNGQMADMSRDERDIIAKAERHLASLRYALGEGPVPHPTPLYGPLLKQLTSLGRAMTLHCKLCGMELNSAEVEFYTRQCMEAGRTSRPEPPRWCARCTPAEPTPSDESADVPF